MSSSYNVSKVEAPEELRFMPIEFDDEGGDYWDKWPEPDVLVPDVVENIYLSENTLLLLAESLEDD